MGIVRHPECLFHCAVLGHDNGYNGHYSDGG
jgi:hypothetical protein